MTLARRGRVTATLLVIVALAALVVLVIQFIATQSAQSSLTPTSVLVRLALIMSVLSGLFYVNRRGYVIEAGLAFSLLTLFANFVLLDLTVDTLPGPAVLIVPVLMAGLLGTPAAAFGIALLAIVSHLYVNLNANPNFLSALGPNIAGLFSLYANVTAVALASFLFARTTNAALEESTEYSLSLTSHQQALEARYERQQRYLRATATVARAIVGVRDLDELLRQTTALIKDTFEYYHVQVFLLDEDNEFAILRQSTGEAGQKLLERGHRLPVGSLSVIGQVTAGGRPVIALDTDAIHRRNELLPNTRAEMALPLLSGNRVTGALDLQSEDLEAFGNEVRPILQTLADQIAIAIDNVRLYEETEISMRRLEELFDETSQRQWSEFLNQARSSERRQTYGPESKSLQVQRSGIVNRVLSAGGVIISTGRDGRQAFLSAPVVVRNEVVGVLGVEPTGPREWSQDDLQLIQGIADRTALAVENARLYLQAQRSADRERLVNTIAQKLQRAPSLALLLESVTQELSGALGTENVYAEINLQSPIADVRRDVSAAGFDDADQEFIEGAMSSVRQEEEAEEQPSVNAAPHDESEEARAEL